jgi:Flp pilus assembly pilin Flp
MAAAESIGGDSLSFEYFRRLKKPSQRGFAIEYTLIAVMLAFAAFQVLLAVGAKAGSI